MKTTVGLLIASVLALWVSPAKADKVSGSGTWGTGTPTTAESAPGDSWAFSFIVSNPVTDATVGPLGYGFQTEEFSAFTYLLNGSPIAATLSSVVFYAPADNGLFDLELSDGDVVSLYGAQVYGGAPPPDMTIIDGVYPATSAMADGVATGSGTVTIGVTPEPSTLSLLFLGLFGAAALSKKKQAGL